MTYVPWGDSTHPSHVAKREIAKELIDNLVDAGYAVAIDNGGEYLEIGPTVRKDKLFNNLAFSDLDYLLVFDFQGRSTVSMKDMVGSVMLVYGNDPFELIADYNLGLEDTIRPALRKAASYDK